MGPAMGCGQRSNKLFGLGGRMGNFMTSLWTNAHKNYNQTSVACITVYNPTTSLLLVKDLVQGPRAHAFALDKQFVLLL
jgi:hypothetical protein